MSSSFISFQSTAARSITDITYQSDGQTARGVSGSELTDNAVFLFEDTFDSLADIKDAGITSANEDTADGKVFLGGTNHVQFRDLFAVVSNNGDNGFDAAGDEMHKLSDTGYGNRLLVDSVADTVGQEDDPVTIFGHGRINNGTVGGAAGLQAGGQGVGFDNQWGFGFDNGPESGNRWINNGDSITFRLNQKAEATQAIKTLSFVINTDQALAGLKFDVDGDVLNSGSYGASANAANEDFVLALAGANGAVVLMDFDARTISIGGVVQSGDDIAKLFDAYEAQLAGGLSQLTIGATDGRRFSIQDLVIERVAPGTLPTANAVLSYEFSGQLLNATLDLGKDGSIEARETLANGFGGGGTVVSEPGADGNLANLPGTGMPIDLLDLTTFGQADGQIGMPTFNSRGQQTGVAAGDPGFQHQTGVLDRSLGIGIDSGADAADPTNGSSLGGNFGDESGGPGNSVNHINRGEFARFDLGDDFAGVSALIDFTVAGGATIAGFDAIVRLYADGVLIETASIDLDQGLTDRLVQDNLGLSTFDRIEIEAVDGAMFALADLDIHVVADTVSVARQIAEVLTVATVLDATDPTPENNDETEPQGGTGNPSSVIQATPTDGGTDRFAAFRDLNDNGHWDLGEAKEDLVSFGNGTAAAESDAPGGLVDLVAAGGGVSGNQFFLGVGTGGHINGSEAISFSLRSAGDEAIAGRVTIRGPVNSNPQNNPLADIAAGTDFLVRLFKDADDDGVIDAGELVEELAFEVATAQQAFTADFADAEAARFDAVQIAAVSNGGAFTLDRIDLFLV